MSDMIAICTCAFEFLTNVFAALVTVSVCHLLSHGCCANCEDTHVHCKVFQICL